MLGLCDLPCVRFTWFLLILCAFFVFQNRHKNTYYVPLQKSHDKNRAWSHESWHSRSKRGQPPQCFQAFSSTRKSLGTNTNLPRMFVETIALALSLALLRLAQVRHIKSIVWGFLNIPVNFITKILIGSFSHSIIGNFRKGFSFVFFMSHEPFAKIKTEIFQRSKQIFL